MLQHRSGGPEQPEQYLVTFFMGHSVVEIIIYVSVHSYRKQTTFPCCYICDIRSKTIMSCYPSEVFQVQKCPCCTKSQVDCVK